MGDLACDIVMVEHWEDLPLGLGVFYLDAANERLALVEELQATGQERQREFEASQAGAQAYADAASERLALVNELHATAQEQQLKLDALNRQRA
jgi:acyl-CoA-binding protein